MCYGCKYLRDQFGNFVECGLLAKEGTHLFVDYYYWNEGYPDDCPKLKEHTEDSPHGLIPWGFLFYANASLMTLVIYF